MKRSKTMKNHMMKGLLLSALLVAAAPAAATVDYYLAAKAFDKTLPDGSTVPMWGYVEDTGGACYNAATNAARLTCVNALPDPVSPGPRLTAGAADPNFRIFLSNGLPERTSVVITGQEMPWSNNNNGPTWDDNSTGARGNNSTKRVRSFGREAVANGGRRPYIWNNFRNTPFVKPGTFVYHSGTHPQKQAYMGLYGAVTKDSAAGEAYPGVAYDNEVILFYSEIDPALNEAVADGIHETSIAYHAKWFLVNGEPYSTDCTDVAPADTIDDASGYPCAGMVQTPDIAAGAAGETTLLRFLSTAGETHVPTLQGLHMTIHAEDGNPYTWQDGATVMATAPREQYSVMLPPLKTKDAIIEPQLEGRYALYDGNGYMTNPTDPNDFDHKDPVGGMLRFLGVGAGTGNLPPVAVNDPDAPAVITAVEGRTITIDVLANDSDPEGQPLTINSFTPATAGTVVCDTASPGGSCDYTAAGPGAATFSYDVTDGVNTSATAATVTVDVVANVAPVAVDDPGTITDVNTPVVINVLANDTDANGDTLEIATFDATSVNGATVSCDTVTGDCTYTPNSAVTDDTFTYVATDGDADSAPATVTVTVNAAPGNTAPVATDDTYSIGEAGILTGNVITDDTGNGPDSDADGDPLTAVQVSADPANAAAFTLNADGSFSYQSTPNYNGQDTFTYMANDGTDDSNLATVTINVTVVNDVPVANADTFYLNSMETTTIAAPGVLDNDTDPDGNPLTAQNGVVTAGTLTLNTDGSFDYLPEEGSNNIAVGTLATFDYVANDGIADSAPATVTLNRELSVSQAVCERLPTGRCNWRIEGRKSNTNNVRVRAFDATTGQRIGTTQTTGTDWTIVTNDSGRNLNLGPINVRVLGGQNLNAVILDFPVTEQ